MSYNTIASMKSDPDLRRRIVACAAMEGQGAPDQWTDLSIWKIVANQEMEAAYASALAAPGPLPAGADEGVITDAMILARVQAVRRGDPLPAPYA